jgi:hypothetical protein
MKCAVCALGRARRQDGAAGRLDPAAVVDADFHLVKQNTLFRTIGVGVGLYRLAAANQINQHEYAALVADTSLTDEQRRATRMDEQLVHLAKK